jgi:hypothetical protein
LHARCARVRPPAPPLHQVHNFDALVGVLLSDVPAPMAGELCCYPGSHLALASHLAAPGAMDALRANGNTVLPTDRTDTLFARPAAHCTGKAGDVFLANYMTAHFIAPNTSPAVRYAVYFRVKGPGFDGQRGGGGGNPRPMLEPWVHWALGGAASSPGAAGAGAGAGAEGVHESAESGGGSGSGGGGGGGGGGGQDLQGVLRQQGVLQELQVVDYFNLNTAAPVAAPQGGGAEWACQSCTLDNSATALACAACGQERHLV